MSAIHSKSAFLYGQIMRSLQSGRYLPGQRIDPATLAAEFKTSPTPVRFALYRLVGEGQLADHARAGLHVPLPTEAARALTAALTMLTTTRPALRALCFIGMG